MKKWRAFKANLDADVILIVGWLAVIVGLELFLLIDSLWYVWRSLPLAMAE